MTAKEVLSPLFPGQTIPPLPLSLVTDRTQAAKKDAMFVCIRGARFDGHALAADAYARGCRIFLAEEPLSLPQDALVLLCENTRRALSEVAARFYSHPSQRLHVIGITGTKGKTTTAMLLTHVLNQNGIPCGYVGTNGIRYADVIQKTQNTTPDPLTLQATLADMSHRGMRAVVLEVSSQALMQYRAWGTHIRTAVFTNLYNDHVGENEHPTWEHYRDCKHTLFTQYGAENAVWNSDDPATPYMRAGCTAKNTVGCTAREDPTSPFAAREILPVRTPNGLGVRFCIADGNVHASLTLPLMGDFNAMNATLAAAVAARVFSIPLSAVAQSLESASVTGRSEVIPLSCGAVAVLDYAHNGESLRATLSALRAYAPRRLICLYGSVGERTQLRRRALAEAAVSLADLSVLTSDNPGREDPEAILDDISRVYLDANAPYIRFADRKDAIEAALALLQAGDILLLAGKGHEDYQLIGTEKRPFSEREILLAHRRLPV